MSDLFQRLAPEKRASVLNASMTEFAEHGYSAASTNAIVRRIGISKGSLFKYFPTKAALLNEVARAASARVAAEREGYLVKAPTTAAVSRRPRSSR